MDDEKRKGNLVKLAVEIDRVNSSCINKKERHV
jgi:hypothetical protein